MGSQDIWPMLCHKQVDCVSPAKLRFHLSHLSMHLSSNQPYRLGLWWPDSSCSQQAHNALTIWCIWSLWGKSIYEVGLYQGTTSPKASLYVSRLSFLPMAFIFLVLWVHFVQTWPMAVEMNTEKNSSMQQRKNIFDHHWWIMSLCEPQLSHVQTEWADLGGFQGQLLILYLIY